MRLYDPDRDRFYVGRIVALCLAVIVAMWGVAAAVWGLGVATAGIYGRGEQIKQVNSATNRTFQYNHFFDLYSTVKTQTAQLRQAQAAALAFHHAHDGQPDTATGTNATEAARLDSVVLGLQNLCVQNFNQYNNDAQKVVTGAQFRDHNLPDKLPDGPDTSCGGMA